MDQDIKTLNLSAADLRAFNSVGIVFAKDVFPQDLQKRHISEDEWKELFKAPPIKSAFDLFNETLTAGLLRTGIVDLDKALTGGFQYGQIIEFCGLPGSGRTCLCLKLCVNATLPQTCGGLDGEVFYAHTDDYFNKPRLEAIAHNNIEENKSDDMKGFNLEIISTRITTLKLNDIAEFMAFIHYMRVWSKEHKLKLLVIDNISHLFKLCDNYKWWRMYMYTALANLQKLAIECRFVIVVTNDMTTRCTSPTNFITVPCLANSFFHRVNIRIVMSKVKEMKGNYYRATLAKNIATDVKEVAFELC